MRCTTGDLLGFRFGGTAEAYLVPVREAPDPVEAERQHEWVKEHPEATNYAMYCGKCVPYTYPDGVEGLTVVDGR